MTVAAATAAGVALALFAVPAVAAPPDPTSAPAPAGGYDDGNYVVVLSDAPLATYAGGVGGYSPTKPAPGGKVDTRTSAAAQYAGYLTSRQNAVANAAGATPTDRYTVALNAFSATLTADQARRAAAQPGVRLVAKDELHKATSDQNSLDFLNIRGANGLWQNIGGRDQAGNGVVVGVIDTGIWPESASFAAPALGTAAPTKDDPYRPYKIGSTIVMNKNDGGTFTGTCETGQQFSESACNTKIIGARYFDKTWLRATPPPLRDDTLSPRDGGGHGSHTASTAAGNGGVDASVDGLNFGKISGVAPGAKLAIYKALWEAKTDELTGAYTSDLVAAVDAAVGDGVDVINYSVGGRAESPANDPVQLAFLSAASAGIFIAAAGGNSGPVASTLDNTSPWLTTAAASTIGAYEGTVALGNGKKYLGVSNTVQTPITNKPLVLANDVKLSGAPRSSAEVCVPGVLDPAKTAGKVVVCDRGFVDRVAKSAEVKRAGGIGMVLLNPTSNSLDADVHSVPTVHLQDSAYTPVKTYAATSGATVSLLPGNQSGQPSIPYPQVAPFSSRGPSLASNGDLLKPDITAPGVSILAAVAPPSNQGRNFDFYSGTSMASPHIAGLAAIYFGQHPKWSPMAIKSAMMTTAQDTVGTTDPFAQGAGEVTPTRMLTPGLVYDAGPEDWLGYLAGVGAIADTGVAPIDPSDYNNPSISIGKLFGQQTVTRRVTATSPGLYYGTVSMPGMAATVTPSILNFDSVGQTKSFTVTFARTTAKFDTAASGALTWTGGGTTVRSPIVITPKAVAAPGSVSGSGVSGSATFTVTPGVTGNFPVQAVGLAANQQESETFLPGDHYLKTLTVGQDAKVAHFHFDSSNPKANLYLQIFRQRENAGPVLVADAEQGAHADVLLTDLKAGDYYVSILDNGGNGTTTKSPTTISYGVVTASDHRGDFSVTPASPQTKAGVPIKLTASWAGLDASKPYLGWIQYIDGSGTIVTVN